MRPTTLGELKRLGIPRARRTVKDELRRNLIGKLKTGEVLFPGIIGYDETVIPALVNAILARHNLILLGLRGQAKTRILRGLTQLLDEAIPVVAGSDLNEDPFFPISAQVRRRVAEEGDDLPIRWLSREERYVEKLATPDVTVADLIGDLDPIKAAKSGLDLSDYSNIHFGLLPRANRGIFAVNELPDLAPKVQVALFNVMQEGDVQIKGFPVRLVLDVLLVFSANPEDYTARGKIITPLKDRIGAEIRTHYPLRVEDGVRITRQEAWTSRGEEKLEVRIPDFMREVVERTAFAGRSHPKVDQQSGVSQRLPITALETALSNAERRCLLASARQGTVRIADLYAAIPALSGKMELTYEGEMKGAETIARELIQRAVYEVFAERCSAMGFDRLIQWFELGGTLRVSDLTPDSEYLGAVRGIQGLEEIFETGGVDWRKDPSLAVAWLEFCLEGLCAHRRLSRSDELGYHREAPEAEADVLNRVREFRSQ
ncbi:MAG: ATP-binding protein [Acidobacteriota bacterium]